MTEPNEAPEGNTSESQREAPLILDIKRLMQGRNEIWIDHEGVRYRLRITRRNKLILQK